MTNEFLAELIGTMILVILGDGVVANVVLNKTKGNASGWIVITAGWAFAVAIAVYCVGHISEAHINPAVTLALASTGLFDWADVPMYISAQMIGAFLGAILVWLAYLPHWKVTDDPAGKLAVFSTGPAIRNPVANFITEAIGTALLVFGILAIAAHAGNFTSPVTGQIDLREVYSVGINPMLVGVLVWAIGLSLGGPTGYAINPARDLGPRLAHALLPIAGKGDSDWSYSWIPILGPIVGGVLGAVGFQALGWGG